jgi:hypothetical protein
MGMKEISDMFNYNVFKSDSDPERLELALLAAGSATAHTLPEDYAKVETVAPPSTPRR